MVVKSFNIKLNLLWNAEAVFYSKIVQNKFTKLTIVTEKYLKKYYTAIVVNV